METTTLRCVKKGEFFKLRPEGKVYVRNHYDRGSKRFAYYDFDDINNEHFGKGDKVVFVDFIF